MEPINQTLRKIVPLDERRRTERAPSAPRPLNGQLLSLQELWIRQPRLMPADCRAKCNGCAGKGCPQCEQCGLVCPVCLGMRFLRRDLPVGHADFGKVVRCASCCEGNNVNPRLEMEVIVNYLRGYIPSREAD